MTNCRHRKARIINKLLITIVIAIMVFSCEKKQNISITKAYPLNINLGVGWNLGNSLDACRKDLGYTYETEQLWGNPLCDEELIDTISRLGFKSIRIPVTYLNHINEGKIDEKWFERIEEIVEWCLERDLYVIINVHHDASMNDSLNWIYADADKYEENRERLINLWTQIAERFKEYDERLIFQGSGEWVNEERSWNRSTDMEDFRITHELNQDFIDTVRSSGGNNAQRYLMISAYSSSCEQDIIEAMFYKDFEDTVKDRLILSVHSYQMDTDEIYKGTQVLVELSNRYRIPVVLDEFGFSKRYSRNTNIEAMKTYYDSGTKSGITMIVWDDGNEYMIVDRTTKKTVDSDFLEIYGLNNK